MANSIGLVSLLQKIHNQLGKARNDAFNAYVNERTAQAKAAAAAEGVSITAEGLRSGLTILFDQFCRAEIQSTVAPPYLAIDAKWQKVWDVTFSKLLEVMTEHISHDSQETRANIKAIHDKTIEELSLREYLDRAKYSEFEEQTPLSVQIARLASNGFGDRLAALLLQRFPVEMAELFGDKLEEPATESPKVSCGADAIEKPNNPNLMDGPALAKTFLITALIDAQEGTKRKPTVNSLLEYLKQQGAPTARDTLYYSVSYAEVRLLAKKHFGLFNRLPPKGMPQDYVPRGSKDQLRNVEAQDHRESTEKDLT